VGRPKQTTVLHKVANPFYGAGQALGNHGLELHEHFKIQAIQLRYCLIEIVRIKFYFYETHPGQSSAETYLRPMLLMSHN
jgi:hypothetical protein